MSKYPLEQLAIIKAKKLDEAEKTLKEKKEVADKAREKLLKAEKERDEVKTHRTDKLEQLRAGLDEGLPSHKIDPMRNYLKIVDEKLHEKERRVAEEQKAVKAADEAVELARAELLKKQKEVEKLKIHRKEWEHEERREEERKEGLESDELGAISHERRKHQK